MRHDPIEPRAYPGGNTLLDRLPDAERALVLRDMRLALLESADLVIRDGNVINEVIFPIDSLLSITARLSDGSAYEVGTLGRQGVLGVEVAFGIETASRASICQIDGSYAAIAREPFLRHFEELPSFRLAVQRAYVAQLFAVEQGLTCNVAHSLGERAARWLLTISHQVGNSAFRLRTEFFAMMLGQPHLPAPIGLRGLVDAGAIAYENEVVEIRDETMLHELACECYTVLRAYWARLLEQDGGQAPARG